MENFSYFQVSTDSKFSYFYFIRILDLLEKSSIHPGKSLVLL